MKGCAADAEGMPKGNALAKEAKDAVYVLQNPLAHHGPDPTLTVAPTEERVTSGSWHYLSKVEEGLVRAQGGLLREMDMLHFAQMGSLRLTQSEAEERLAAEIAPVVSTGAGEVLGDIKGSPVLDGQLPKAHEAPEGARRNSPDVGVK